jgi:hypothetical protein
MVLILSSVADLGDYHSPWINFSRTRDAARRSHGFELEGELEKADRSSSQRDPAMR